MMCLLLAVVVAAILYRLKAADLLEVQLLLLIFRLETTPLQAISHSFSITRIQMAAAVALLYRMSGDLLSLMLVAAKVARIKAARILVVN